MPYALLLRASFSIFKWGMTAVKRCLRVEDVPSKFTGVLFLLVWFFDSPFLDIIRAVERRTCSWILMDGNEDEWIV